MSCEGVEKVNIYNRLAKAVEEGLRRVVLNTAFEIDTSDLYIRYKRIDFGTFDIVFGMQESIVDNAELEGQRVPIFEWYARLDIYEENFYITLPSNMFGCALVCKSGFFELNGRKEKDTSQQEALDFLLPRIVKRLREDELVYILEFLAVKEPELEAVKEAMKEWRLYCAYCGI